MCAEYEIRKNQKELVDEIPFKVTVERPNLEWPVRIKPTLKAPILYPVGSEIHIKPAVFPVRPTCNARLSGFKLKKNEEATLKTPVQKIYDLWSWRAGIESSPAVSIMTSFFEPAYWGEDIGKVIEFKPKGGGLLYCAAIEAQPIVPPVTDVSALALITDTPNEFMIQWHRRRLKFLNGERDIKTYFSLSSAKERYEFLAQLEFFPDLEASVARQMASGWQKRVDERVAELEEEKLFMRVMEAN